MTAHDEPSLTIGDVAARTGISVATLRAWEVRHHFPVPERLANGHRRYRPRDVATIKQLVQQRADGVTLAAALARVRREATPPRSIFAGLSLLHPNLPTHALTKRTMGAISSAIEDQSCAAGNGAVLIGSFQREHFYRQSELRWRDLARTAAAAIVFADFPTTGTPAGGPVEVPVPSHSSLIREWAVICDGPGAAAVLTGWEVPEPRRSSGRDPTFEATWSADPTVVRDAIRIGLTLATALGAAVAGTVETSLPAVDDPVAALHRATSLTNRIVAALE